MSMSKLRVTLTGPGGKVDSFEFELERDTGRPIRITARVIEWLETEGVWLCAGDTITITEVKK